MRILIQLLTNVTPVIFAAIFHMVVVKKQWLKSWVYPLDHYKKYKGKRIFGDNKTYRGLIVMILASIFFSFLYFQWLPYSPSWKGHNLLYISPYSFIQYGFLFGIGYVVGELPNSFYKRQIGVVPGKSDSVMMTIVDQLDSAIIIMLLLIVFSSFTWLHFVIGIFFYGGIHIVINYLLYLIGLRKEPF